MYINFNTRAARNTVSLFVIYVIHNTLITPHISTGGGILVTFETDKAMFATENRVIMNNSNIIHNQAIGGVGGGLSVLYVHSPFTGDSGDEVYLNDSTFVDNQADYGHAYALQSSPQYRKALFHGITLIETKCFCIKSRWYDEEFDKLYRTMFAATFEEYYKNSTKDNSYDLKALDNIVIAMNVTSELMKKQDNPFFQMQIQTNTSLVFLSSVQIRLQGELYCGAASQGILAVDSEITLQPYSSTKLSYCVAPHGGAIALYGESYIRVSTQSFLILRNNYAFQRGGAIYVHPTTHAVPHVRCFIQYEQGQAPAVNHSGILFQDNSAKREGQSVYISEADSCIDSYL